MRKPQGNELGVPPYMRPLRLKLCARCATPLPLDCFYRIRRNEPTRDYYCKTCRNRASVAWVKADPVRRLRANASNKLSYQRRRKKAQR